MKSFYTFIVIIYVKRKKESLKRFLSANAMKTPQFIVDCPLVVRHFSGANTTAGHNKPIKKKKVSAVSLVRSAG